MFKIDSKKTIYLTRGDVAIINVTATNNDGSEYTFKNGDVVRLSIFKAGNCHNVVLKKDVSVEEDKNYVEISLTSAETKIGDIINEPVDYWYEIVLNPETEPQTIVGYFKDPVIFRLLPEGGCSNE